MTRRTRHAQHVEGMRACVADVLANGIDLHGIGDKAARQFIIQELEYFQMMIDPDIDLSFGQIYLLLREVRLADDIRANALQLVG
jgi:hypothetical protein